MAEKNEIAMEKCDMSDEDPQLKPKEAAVPKDIDTPLPSGAAIRGISTPAWSDYHWLALAVPTSILVACTFTASGLIFGHTASALSSCMSTLVIVGCVSENLVYRVRLLSFRSLLEQSVEWHTSENRNSTALLGVITKDGASLAAFSGSVIATSFSIIVNFIVAIIVSHAFAWKIALVSLAMVPILLSAGMLQIRTASRHQERSHEAFVKAISITIEAVN
ncbi:hypothetical protein DL771_006579 [Monosporascus sp. 5C6A]|nr:hypothetical protein DL771_006579 [Monosporascus sp. 5C6A]